MTAVKLASLEAFLKKPQSSIGAILFYGADPVAVRNSAASAVKRLAGSLDDPFRVVVIDDTELSADVGQLTDFVQSQSLLGGNKVIWVRSAEQAFLRAASGIMEGSVHGNLVVAEAGNLARGSALRRKFEDSKSALIIAIYEQESIDAELAARNALSASGLGIHEDALALFLEIVGLSVSHMMHEVEKLSAYCKGKNSVTVEDVRRICGTTPEFEMDDLVDATFNGHVAQADHYFQQLVQAGIDPSRVLSGALFHATRLLDCRRSIDRGMRVEQALRVTQPPLFFKRQPAVLTQLNRWTLDMLLSAASSLGVAISQSRQHPKLAAEIANRALIAISRIPRSSGLKSS